LSEIILFNNGDTNIKKKVKKKRRKKIEKWEKAEEYKILLIIN
jgi:hypothetical protein